MTADAQSPPTSVALARRILRAMLSTLLALAILWAALALWLDGPESRLLAGLLVAGLLLAAGFIVWRGGARPRAALGLLLLFAVVLGWWLTLTPSNNRDWQSPVARLPYATLDGPWLTIRNVRNFRYAADGSVIEDWVTRTYNLDELVGFDVFISFWGPTLYGHTISSWEFADGRHLAISIETRKEAGETYSALRGFYREFELYYVVAEETDVIALRTNQRRERVELYRIATTEEGDRDLLLDYIDEMNALVVKPSWYNALTNNCTTVIWHHAKAVGSRFPLDWRLLANGHLVELAYEVGAVNKELGLDELRARSDITSLARAVAADQDFSKAIRQDLPARPPTIRLPVTNE